MTEHTEIEQEILPNILIVDDNFANLVALEAAIAHSDLRVNVIKANDALQALELATRSDLALILLDVMMPGMDGLEVCRRLKKSALTSTIPVIFLTAKTSTNDIVAGFDAGGVDYIRKPFERRELIARIKTHIQLSQLKSLLRVCSACGAIHNETGEWERMDTYIQRQTGQMVSHGYCPVCYEKAIAEID